MASLRHWYTGQLVTAQEMRGGDEALQNGEYTLTTDLGFTGIFSGYEVTEKAGTPNLSVDVALGLAYSPIGERIRTAGTVNVNCAFDRLGNPTAVQNPGNSRYLDVYAVFDRLPNTPRTDATGATVYFVQDESFAFEVVQGGEAVTPSAPSALGDGVLLARVLIEHAQTTIVNADINTTVAARLVKLTGSPLSVTSGLYHAALQAIVTRYNDHVNGLADAHSGAGMTYGGSGAWADTTTVASGTVESGMDGIVSALAATTTGNSGAHKIGVAADTGAPIPLVAMHLNDRLVALRSAANLGYAGGPTWANSASNLAQSVESMFDSMITDLASTSVAGRGSGGSKIGMDAFANFTAGTIRDFFVQIGSSAGDTKVGTIAKSGSPTALAGVTVFDQVGELLAAVNARARIGSAETITGGWTFSTAPTMGGALNVALTSRNNTRTVRSAAWAIPGSGPWAMGTDGFPVQSSNTAGSIYAVLEYPHGSTIRAVTVVLDGGGGHVSAPTTPPVVEIERITRATGAITSLGSQSDPQATLPTLAAYNAPHDVTVDLTGAPVTVDIDTYYYRVKVTGESGSGSLPNLRALALSRQGGFTSYTEG